MTTVAPFLDILMSSGLGFLSRLNLYENPEHPPPSTDTLRIWFWLSFSFWMILLILLAAFCDSATL